MGICRSKLASFHRQRWPQHVKQQTVCSSDKLCQITDKIVELKYVSNYFDPSHHRNPLYAFQIFIHSRQNIQKYICHTFTDLLSSCPCIYFYLLWNSKEDFFLPRGSLFLNSRVGDVRCEWLIDWLYNVLRRICNILWNRYTCTFYMYYVYVDYVSPASKMLSVGYLNDMFLRRKPHIPRLFITAIVAR